jgi:hypothetical protein
VEVGINTPYEVGEEERKARVRAKAKVRGKKGQIWMLAKEKKQRKKERKEENQQ